MDSVIPEMSHEERVAFEALPEQLLSTGAVGQKHVRLLLESGPPDRREIPIYAALHD